MTRKQWEKWVLLPGFIVFFVAMYVAALLFYRYVKKHESRRDDINQPYKETE